VNTPLLCSQNSGTPQDDLIKLRTELKKVRTELKEMQDAFSSFKNVNTKLQETISELSPIGAILPFAGKELPYGWLECKGQILSTEDPDFKALFAVIENSFGGDKDKKEFKLPDLQGRAVIGAGQGATLSARQIGAQFGSEQHELQGQELPDHAHTVLPHHHIWMWSGGGAGFRDGGGYENAVRDAQGSIMGVPGGGSFTNSKAHGAYITSDENVTIQTATNVGKGAAFSTMPPSLVVAYIIRYK
jgi:microcystin-dependent protein